MFILGFTCSENARLCSFEALLVQAKVSYVHLGLYLFKKCSLMFISGFSYLRKGCFSLIALRCDSFLFLSISNVICFFCCIFAAVNRAGEKCALC